MSTPLAATRWLLLTAVAAWAAQPEPLQEPGAMPSEPAIRVTGRPVPGLESFDRLISSFLPHFLPSLSPLC